MIRASLRRTLPVIAAGMLLMTAAWSQGRGRKYKPPPPTCKITVTVLKSADGKPVSDAAVVFQPIKDKKIRGDMELKTDEDGKTTLNMIPVGDNVLLQVIANGFQTFGKVYELPDGTKEITVKLDLPAPEYSIYKKHPKQHDDGSSSSSNGSQNNPKDSQQNPPQ